jgi:hypothetical protein
MDIEEEVENKDENQRSTVEKYQSYPPPSHTGLHINETVREELTRRSINKFQQSGVEKEG